MARPNGVAAQMNVDFGGADSIPCWGIYDHQPEKPTIAVNARTDPSVTVASITSPVQICLFRFSPGRPIQVTIRSPAGRVERLTAPLRVRPPTVPPRPPGARYQEIRLVTTT
jgi:hypothetical protein